MSKVTKIRAKQLHEDVSGLVNQYGSDIFLRKDQIVNVDEIISGLTGASGLVFRERINIPSGVSGVNLDISDYQFQSIPFVNYSLISPNENSSFFIHHVANLTEDNISLYFSDTVDSDNYYVDVLFGVSSSFFTVQNTEFLIEDVSDPSSKYRLAVSGGSIIAIPD